jgi:hypothetical protein
LPTTLDNLQTLLKDSLESFQTQFIQGTSEYELIKALQEPPYALFNKGALSDSLVMFQTHFVLFHCLYQLRNTWRAERVGELEIGPTLIKLHESVPREPALETADPLADYYLNWDNLKDTDAAGVEALLESFWQKMGGISSVELATQDEIQHAITLLELPSVDNLTVAQLKQHYRKQQHAAHPDKGGSIEQSQLVLQAYTLLRKYLIHQQAMGKPSI